VVLAAYLDRIGASAPLHPSRSTLIELHDLHMVTVPFENLDIPLGREIVMDGSLFLEKIVRQRRGGFCYELNGAFAWLLKEVGFDVSLLSAGVFNAEGVAGPDFDHMALRVTIDGESLLADVGFGDSFRSPLRLQAGEVQRDNDPRGIEYLLTEEEGTWVLWKRDGSGEWVRRYWFTLAPRRLEEYAEMCRHQQTSPESSFTQRIVCSRATDEGRLTLSATELIETTPAGREETPVAREEWYRVLQDRFGVELPGEITRWP
jgi:N-hydroxyarylamine O-acetyltransferase